MTSKAERILEAWERNLWDALLLDTNQQGMTAWLDRVWEKNRLLVVNKSRQLGGSYWALIQACLLAMSMPGAQIKYAAQTQKQVRKILRPHMRAIFKTCPEALRPRYHSQDGEFRFPNGSSITVAGCDRDNAETLRGQHADFAIVDEGGAIANLQYVIDDILMPQTLNTRGRILIISSPAKRPGHPFKAFCDLAESQGTLLERTIHDNPRITEEEKDELCRAAGGIDSTTWKREYLAQHVTDEESAVIPEATRAQLKLQTLVLEHDGDLSYRPSHFDTYLWVDPGWSPDFTGILWAIWDFARGRVVIEDEFLMRRMNTDMLAGVLREKTDALWGKNHKPYQAVADVDHRLISDLSGRGWNFVPYQRDNLDEAVNKLRLSVSGQSIPFWTHPRCVATRRQFENCIWNKARTRFERTALDGHFDLVAAGYIGRRNLHTWRNPIPKTYAFGSHDGLIMGEQKELTKTQRVFRSLWKSR